MKKIDKIIFWGLIFWHALSAIVAGLASQWVTLIWIIASTVWMAESFFADKRAYWYLRESIEALEEARKTHFDCFKLTIENYGLKTKNHLLEKDYNKRQIRRKMHFDRLREVTK